MRLTLRRNTFFEGEKLGVVRAIVGGTGICRSKRFISGSFSTSLNVTISGLGGLFILPTFYSMRIRLHRPNFSCGRAVLSNAETTTHNNFSSMFSVPGLGPIPSDIRGLRGRLSVVGGSTIVGIRPCTSVAIKRGNRTLSSFRKVYSVTVTFSSSKQNIRSRSVVQDTVVGTGTLGGVVITRYRRGDLLGNNCVRSNRCTGLGKRGNVYSVDR